MSTKVLVADDSQTIRSVAEFLLRQKGYEVILAQDGEETLNLIKKSSPDLILLDNSMPVIDGYTICQELKKNNILKDIPVVMLLDSRESVNQEAFANAGCESYIFKPFSPREFLEKVGEYLRKKDQSVGIRVEEIPEVEGFKGSTESSGELKNLPKFEFKEEEKEIEEKIAQPETKEEEGYHRFVTEFKKEMEGLQEDEPLVYREMKMQASDKKKEVSPKEMDYEVLTQRIVEQVSAKVAEKIVEKIDTGEIEQMIKESVKERA